MFSEIERFSRWLRFQSSHTATDIQYSNDVTLEDM